MIEKDKLKKYANLLMFDMKDEEYEVLQKEFVSMEKEIEAISKFKGISEIEPMHFPFTLESVILNEDTFEDNISNEEALLNVREKEDGEVKLPKVVASNDN